MGKQKKPESKPSRAEELIAAAVRQVDEEAGEELREFNQSEEVREKPGAVKTSITKIDPQQVVDKESYLRLMADFENFRKRALKDRQESERAGREKTLRGFLEIFDNLERGLAQAQGDNGPLAAGLRMILVQAENWFKQEGLERIPTLGKMFDPTVHEAVAQIEAPGKNLGQIVEEVKRGYRWPDRVLRPAAVITAKPGGSDKSEPEIPEA